MTEKQAFEILRKYGRANDARIISRHIAGRTGNKKSMLYALCSMLCALRAARALRRGTPVAKIVGRKWFYGMEFETGRYTLDPRPDSETLVEAVLESYPSQKGRNSLASDSEIKNSGVVDYPGNLGQQVAKVSGPSGKGMPKILDLGTGTGNLICSIIKNIPGAVGVGIDKSWRACRVARRNVKRHDLEDRIKILKKDFSTFDFRLSTFDFIISNPPYIADGDPRVDSGARHDPKLALYAGADGLSAYRAIAASAKQYLKPGGRIFLEIGAGSGAAVRDIFENAGWQFVQSQKDLSGTERVMIFILDLNSL
ncbi:MAG: peptide chain release factor N(5)-glutamine methyltransferase [Alphaproteobacteria bacterium]|nr:peptide chain release factor N(5)-glutamine methyltransferase [Alphaproteobacteria bacterium]